MAWPFDFTINQVIIGTHAADNFGPGLGDDTYVMTADNFVTDNINGGSGTDTVDYSNQQGGTGVNITLTDPTSAGAASGGTVTADFPMYIINPTTHQEMLLGHHVQLAANLTSIENATGTNNNDVLTGNSGNNVLTGGGGLDLLTGGAGHDTFIFNNATDSPAVPLGTAVFNSLDRITDFTPGEDHIDLRGLANETAGGAQLHFVSALSGAPGEVVAAFMSDHTADHTGFLVAADLNGDHNPDFEVFVNTTVDHVHLGASDFILH
jgi:Ca2+-binding RTX toxin-like protein